MVFAGFLTDAVLRVYAQNRFLILLSSIKLLLVLLTIQWFLIRFDLIGAVLVTLMVAIIAKLIALGRVMFLMETRLADFLPWRSLGLISVITIAATLLTISFKNLLDFSGLPLLLITGSVYTVIYTGLLVLLGPLDQRERQVLWGFVQNPVMRFCRNLKF